MPEQQPLITRRDVINLGAGSGFVSQFDVQPIDVTVETGGALGTATVKWRQHGATDWSQAQLSSAGSSWTWDAPDPAWASIVLPAATYVADDAWTIDAGGTVTTTHGSRTITATRVDIVALVCMQVTGEFVNDAQPRCVPPIISVGDVERGWLADVAIYRLKSRQGMTPSQAGTGDENLYQRYLAAKREFEKVGRAANRPPTIIDSSSGGRGAGIPLMPRSRSRRGFGNFS